MKLEALENKQQHRTITRGVLCNLNQLPTSFDCENPVQVSVAMFELGYELDLAGRREDADKVYRQSIALAEKLSAENKNALRASDLAKLAFKHGKNLYGLGRYNEARTAFARCLEILDSIVPANVCYLAIEELAFANAWLARSQRKSTSQMSLNCQLSKAAGTYQKAATLWNSLILLPKSVQDKKRYQHHLGCTLLGYAKVLTSLGQLEEAKQANLQALALVDSELYAAAVASIAG